MNESTTDTGTEKNEERISGFITIKIKNQLLISSVFFKNF
jgi:hypothetical protein